MQKPRISMIAAIQEKDRGLGFQNKLLFRISEDLKRFKELTKGHVIIMGRKTFESLGQSPAGEQIGRPLPNRINIVITSKPEAMPKGVIAATSVEDAIEKGRKLELDEVFIIGGGMVYEQSMPFADRLYLTLIRGTKEADTFFPDYSEFTRTINAEVHTDSASGLNYGYLTLEREK